MLLSRLVILRLRQPSALGNLSQSLTFPQPSPEDVSHIVIYLVERHRSIVLRRRKANTQARMWSSNIGRIDQEI